ncbi:hypothetical protein [Dyadobacter chenhuakuii]|nr:hypothetical protein [Dyadobacter chenhuakuii]MCF2495408.1 hypothetical protein [Dyadobacter chenhuakuii]USJ29446.1 hypothetical protein NFI80_16355 [Dyadobacter chenhuakuii]
MQRPNFIIISTSLLFFVTCNLCYAQQFPKYEIQLGFGPLAREQIIDDAVETLLGTASLDPIRMGDFSNSFNLSLRYQRRQWISIGLALGFTTKTTYRTDYSESKSFYKHSNFMSTFEAKYIYLDHPFVQLYGVTGFGILLVKTKDQRFPHDTKMYGWPTTQLTPIAIRIGKKFGGFAEMGYGYKGIVNFGVSARF